MSNNSNETIDNLIWKDNEFKDTVFEGINNLFQKNDKDIYQIDYKNDNDYTISTNNLIIYENLIFNDK